MKRSSLIIIVLTLIFVLNFIPKKSNCAEEILKGYSPMGICTDGKSIDEFLSEFELNKVNKIIFKEIILAGETRIGEKTLTTIKNKEKVAWIISAINKVQCYKNPVIAYCLTELWLYENNKLRLKLALFITPIRTKVRFYRPEHVPYTDRDLGREGTFIIVDKKLCIWLLEHLAAVHIEYRKLMEEYQDMDEDEKGDHQ